MNTVVLLCNNEDKIFKYTVPEAYFTPCCLLLKGIS